LFTNIESFILTAKTVTCGVLSLSFICMFGSILLSTTKSLSEFDSLKCRGSPFVLLLQPLCRYHPRRFVLRIKGEGRCKMSNDRSAWRNSLRRQPST